MRKDRLLKLANFLETLPKEGLDMRKWSEAMTPSCGYRACAIGWATTIFKDEGFHMEKSDSIYPSFYPVCDSNYGWEAVWVFFDLSWQQAESLFGDHNPDDPKYIASHIRDFVNDN